MGGPPKPEVLQSNPLVNPTNSDVSLSLLIWIVFPEKRKNPDISITTDITMVNKDSRTVERIIIPIGIPMIAVPAMGRTLLGLSEFLLPIAIR